VQPPTLRTAVSSPLLCPESGCHPGPARQRPNHPGQSLSGTISSSMVSRSGRTSWGGRNSGRCLRAAPSSELEGVGLGQLLRTRHLRVCRECAAHECRECTDYPPSGVSKRPPLFFGHGPTRPCELFHVATADSLAEERAVAACGRGGEGAGRVVDGVETGVDVVAVVGRSLRAGEVRAAGERLSCRDARGNRH